MTVDRRIRKGATDTLTAIFYDGGEAIIDKGAVTVSVASDTGTVLQAGSATNTVGTYTFGLTTASTVALDMLKVTWTAATETLTSYVDVVGGFYFDLAELRAMQDLTSAVTYPTDRLRGARQWIEDIIDITVGVSFVRRYARDISVQPFRPFNLRTPYAASLLSLTVGGTAYTAPQLAALSIDPANKIVRSPDGGPWTFGYGTIDVRYEAGLTTTCPADLHDAALQAARWRLISTDGASGIPNRATSLTNQFGNVQLSTAGNRRPTGIPDVDAVIMSYADNFRTPGIA